MPSVLINVRPYVYPGDVVDKLDRNCIKNAKILFINMPLRETAVPNCLPLGPALLAATLRQWEAVPTMIDLNAYRFKDANAELKGLKNGRTINEVEAADLIRGHIRVHRMPDMVAMSGMITTLRWQMSVAKIVRNLMPDVFLVTGNGLATEFKEGLFQWIPELDGVAHSEGDLSIIKMTYDAVQIKRLGQHGAYLSGNLDPYCLGLVGSNETNVSKYRFLYDGGRPKNLDDLSFPAYDLLEKDVNGFPVLETYIKNEIWGLKANNSSATSFTMKRSINTVSSRGCPFQCSYCFRGATGERNYAVRSAKNLAEEFIHYADKYNIDFVGVTDDNFCVQRKRILDMEPYFIPLVRKSNIRWGTHARLDEAADLTPNRHGEGFIFNNPKRVDSMAKSGCVYIGFGGESAHKTTLENMGKGGFILVNGFVNWRGFEFPRTMVEGIKNTKYSGIDANSTWIRQFPGETLDQLKTTIAFIMWQKEFYSQFGDGSESVNRNMFLATAYPGTEMFKHPIVRQKLHDNFGINYDQFGTPVIDDNLKYYVLELDDADKIMKDQQGRILNYGELTEDQFMEADGYVKSNRIEKILEMK